ncbi:uncharacterized protein LOC126323757 isoform X1 [Schistocerca gregaria]|uniref:uncharacterized protein LOC126323757 isoform X1 n=1 Tax=Schistocerca gregaria TaxID=7010 RepID=UPI00211E6037|nr:uncharacterized protein LOC126323757 isoform X1 [Schistocerca gregaria]
MIESQSGRDLESSKRSEVTEPADIEKFNDITLINAKRARPQLEREIVKWTNEKFIPICRMKTVQIAYTRCGRFAIVISVPSVVNFGFGVRLMTLDLYGRLCIYFIGAYRTLESATRESEKRIRQIEYVMDELNSSLKHGDVVLVDHLGYSHVAIYDAEKRVFYELFGDVESGINALHYELNKFLLGVTKSLLWFHLGVLRTVNCVFKSVLGLDFPRTYLIERCRRNNEKLPSFEELNKMHPPQRKRLWVENPISDRREILADRPPLSAREDEHPGGEGTPKGGVGRLPEIKRRLKSLDSDKESSDVTDQQDLRDSSLSSDGEGTASQSQEPFVRMRFGRSSNSIAEITETPLDIFVSRDPLLKIRRKFYANSLPPYETVFRARSMLGTPGWNPVTKNCEHFVTWAKTGKTESSQVHQFSSGTAIAGVTTLQSIVIICFFSFTFLYILKKFFVTTWIEMIEWALFCTLKVTVVLTTVIFLLGIWIYQLDGSSANYDTLFRRNA